jgi:hypothetical protein
VIGILLAGLTLYAAGCFPIEILNLKYTLPTECTAAYSPSIGKDLVIGESSEEVLRKVGKPNEAIKEKGYTYYVYFVQPYLLREIGGKYLGACGSGPYADSSMYYVTFDADKRIESIVYYLPAGAASRQVKVPGTDGLMLPATLYSPRGCSAERKPAIVLLHGWLDEGAKDAMLEGYADLFAEQGYVVLVPLMRGWGGGQNDCGLSQPADTVRMIEWLASQPGVDPDRVGVVGVLVRRASRIAGRRAYSSRQGNRLVLRPHRSGEAEGLGHELRAGSEETLASLGGWPNKGTCVVDSRRCRHDRTSRAS